jgi:hypothetical protein
MQNIQLMPTTSIINVFRAASLPKHNYVQYCEELLRRGVVKQDGSQVKTVFINFLSIEKCAKLSTNSTITGFCDKK